MAENESDLVLAYLDGSASESQTQELWRRLPGEPTLARHLAVQSMITSTLEKMSRQNLEETNLMRAVSDSPRRGRCNVRLDSPPVLRYSRIAVAAVLVSAAVGLYFLLNRPQPAAPPTAPTVPAPSMTDRLVTTTPVKPTPSPTSTDAIETPELRSAFVDGRTLFEDNFQTDLGKWTIAENAAEYVRIETIQRNGTESKGLVIDLLAMKGTSVVVTSTRSPRAAAMALDYDYLISEPGGALCPCFGFSVVNQKSLDKMQYFPANKNGGPHKKIGAWVHARVEFMSIACPVNGRSIWIQRFEDGRPVCSYLVPGTTRDIHVGSFLMSDTRVALDNVTVKATKRRKKDK